MDPLYTPMDSLANQTPKGEGDLNFLKKSNLFIYIVIHNMQFVSCEQYFKSCVQCTKVIIKDCELLCK